MNANPGIKGKLSLWLNRRLRTEVRERRQTEHALRESTEFLEMAQSAGGIGIFDLNLQNGQLNGSPLFFEILGLHPGNLKITRDQWLACVHPEDLEVLVYDFQQAVGKGDRFSIEYRTVRPDGSFIWVL